MIRTWILVADAAHARLFQTTTDKPQWTLIDEFNNPQGRAKSRDFLSDASGSIQHGEGAIQRGAMEPLSIKKVEERHFARAINDVFAKALGRFDRLILVAPPELLGMLRDELSPPVAQRVFDSVAKDYARANVRELTERLEIAQLV